MKRWAFLLSLLLVSLPALAQQKDKKDEKKKPAGPATAEDLVKEAEAKAAAGDAEGAVETLRRACEMPAPGGGDGCLRLGLLLERLRYIHPRPSVLHHRSSFHWRSVPPGAWCNRASPSRSMSCATRRTSTVPGNPRLLTATTYRLPTSRLASACPVEAS